nr:peptidyl-prolyl cis-trans isomerase [Quercus suber]
MVPANSDPEKPEHAMSGTWRHREASTAGGSQVQRTTMLRARLTRSLQPLLTQTRTITTMGVTKQLISPGNGTDKPKAGDNITMEYTGTLYDPSAPNNKGKQFDSSVGRGDFNTRIGVGQVIKGWDEGVLTTDGGMTLGEKCTLTISGDYAYGDRGFPGLIPPNATLVFDVQLKAINNKKA